MKISGFTIVKNGALMGYPFIESIKSCLPLVDEMIVGVGKSEDNSRELVEAIGDPKIRIIDTVWDPSKTEGGRLLSEKTNEVLDLCQNDWCLYIQADEVLHEQDIAAIRQQVERFANDPGVEGLHFKYTHFYGSFDTIATSRLWYRDEVRMVRRSSGARSRGDAQGFRIHAKRFMRSPERRLKTQPANGTVYHYGWVRPPQTMAVKSKLFHRLWHGNERDAEFETFEYEHIYGLKKFSGSHPQVMHERVRGQNWNTAFRRPLLGCKLSEIRLWLSDVIEAVIGFQPWQHKNHD